MSTFENNDDGSAQLPQLAAPTHVGVLQKMRIVIRSAQHHSAATEKVCGVSGAQLWVMQELSEAPGLRVGDIAARLAIHQTTASNLLEVLARKGLILKQRDSVDQRVVRLALSPQGAAVIAGAPKPARGLLPDALRRLDPESLRTLDHGLDQLLGVMQDVDAAQALQPLPFTM